jgi:hypothetical protein
MSFWEIEEQVKEKVRAYCHNKGFQETEDTNNFIPHDCIKAFQMAKLLTSQGFDIYLAIAPEGFIYSYFFEAFGAKIISVTADYPPTYVKANEDLSAVKGKSVLVIEDDVIGGGTLRLLVKELAPHEPKELSVYLGHNKNIQRLHNVPPEYKKSYVAEDVLDRQKWLQYEREFIEFFQKPT